MSILLGGDGLYHCGRPITSLLEQIRIPRGVQPCAAGVRPAAMFGPIAEPQTRRLQRKRTSAGEATRAEILTWKHVES
jgi:hypothetical protein